MSTSISARPLAADILADCGYKSSKPAPLATLPASRPPAKSMTLPELQATSSEETAFRAYFLAIAVINNHKMMLCSLAERFRMPVNTKPVQEKINRANKILACASLFLIGLESGGIHNKAAMDLLFSALRVVEKIAVDNSVKDLVSLFGNCQAGELNGTLCHLVARALELNAANENELESFVCSEFSYRKEILGYACRQEIAALKEQVVCFL